MSAEQARLLGLVRAYLPQARRAAGQADQTAQFPAASFEYLRKIGLYTATLPAALGGAGFGEDAAGAAALLDLFVALGEGDLAVARLYEAHVNALQLVCRYGAPGLVADCAAAAAQGALFALWVTDPPEGGLALGADGVLAGEKAFCSGAGVAARALVTATCAEGVRMLIVKPGPDTPVFPGAMKLAGMRAAVTGRVEFTGMRVDPAAMLGGVGDYLREPVFSAGAWRGSAGALGGLSALVGLCRAELLRRRRDGDAHQLARFGALVRAHETARLWMSQAAKRACLEDDGDAAVVAYVNLARLAVEAACLEGMQLVQRGLGLGAFAAGHEVERICRDLGTYLRQPAPDETLVKAAAHYFHHDLPGAR